jgi:histidinol-phosphate aminotransferase
MKHVDISRLARPSILRVKAYSSARDEHSGSARAFLDANENPYPSPFNRYPDPHQRKLRVALSNVKGVPPDCILPGNGSDELIDLLIRAFCEPARDSVIVCEPTYGMYSVCSSVNDVEVLSVPLTREFQPDLPALHAVIATRQPKLLFLCSPNNPTGNLLDPHILTELISEFHGLVVIDEAYIDFSSRASWVSQLGSSPNLVVLQTLSKAWGLASLRLGIALADSSIISLLETIKAPYNISGPSQEEAIRYLNDPSRKDQAVRRIIEQRQWLEASLKALPQVEKVFTSEANFLLVRFASRPAVVDRLRQEGIIVRDRSAALYCEGCLRITVGTEEENQLLIQTIRST